MIYILILIAVICAVVAFILLRQKPKSIPEPGQTVSSKNGSVYVFLRPTSKGRFMFRFKGKIVSFDYESLESNGLAKRYDFKSVRKN